MKKRLVLCIALLLFVSLLLTSCGGLQYRDSLDEYKEQLAKLDGGGFSDMHMDCATSYFIPSITFLDDYEYIEGTYHLHEHDSITLINLDKADHGRVVLTVTYDSDIYAKAKQFTFDSLPAYNDTVYRYNEYQFYLNGNYITQKWSKEFDEDEWQIIYDFNMVGYNDENCTLVFLSFRRAKEALKGFKDIEFIDPKNKDDLENNFVPFIDAYYSEFYDFSQ